MMDQSNVTIGRRPFLTVAWGIALFLSLSSGCQRYTPANENVPAAASPTSTTDVDVTTDVEAMMDVDAITDLETAVDVEAADDTEITADESATSNPVAQQQETTTAVASTDDANTADQEEKKSTTSRSPDNAQPNTGATPASMKVRPRTTARADGVFDLTFDDFEFKIEKDAKFERSLLSDKIEEFDGNEILIRGFILDSSVFQLKNIKQFVLVRDNQQCCFGPGAYLFHNMQVEMVPGETANFSIRPVTIQGKFQIKPWIGPDGKCYSVYHVTAKSVK